jgi:hypothetical protein
VLWFAISRLENIAERKLKKPEQKSSNELRLLSKRSLEELMQLMPAKDALAQPAEEEIFARIYEERSPSDINERRSSTIRNTSTTTSPEVPLRSVETLGIPTEQ